MRSVSESWHVLSQHLPKGIELPGAASAEAIHLAEEQLGIRLPADLYELYLTHNGFGQAFVYPVDSTEDTQRIYPIEAAVGTYSIWTTVRHALEDEGKRLGKPSIPEALLWKKNWLPITVNLRSRDIFVELSGNFSGRICQAASFWQPGTEITVLATDVRTWLDQLASRLKSGQYKFDSPCPTLPSGPL